MDANLRKVLKGPISSGCSLVPTDGKSHKVAYAVKLYIIGSYLKCLARRWSRSF
jgi:hypothetical protein